MPQKESEVGDGERGKHVWCGGACCSLTSGVGGQDAEFHARVHLADGGARGTDASFAVLKSLAEGGDTQSQLDLGWAYLSGRGHEEVDVPDHRELARQWFEKALVSATDDAIRANAQSILDEMYCQDNVSLSAPRTRVLELTDDGRARTCREGTHAPSI